MTCKKIWFFFWEHGKDNDLICGANYNYIDVSETTGLIFPNSDNNLLILCLIMWNCVWPKLPKSEIINNCIKLDVVNCYIVFGYLQHCYYNCLYAKLRK